MKMKIITKHEKELLTLRCEVEVVKIIPINVSSVNNINDGLLNVSDSHTFGKQNGEWRLLRTLNKDRDFLTDEFGMK
jgi:hypothetical protein